MLLEKIVGGLAETGAPLAQVAELARKVNNQGRSMGMALTSCTVPSVGKPTFELGEDEMEIGIGIHGEPGRRRVKLASAAEVTEMLATPVIEDLGLKAGDRVILKRVLPREMRITFGRSREKTNVLKLAPTWKIIDGEF